MYLPLCSLHARGPITTSQAEVIFDGDLQEYRVIIFDLVKQETTSHPLPDALQAQFLAEHLTPAEAESSLSYSLALDVAQGLLSAQGG